MKKPKIKNYWRPTPKKWRKVGDSLLAVSTILSIGGLWGFDNLKEILDPNELKYLITGSIFAGVIGKFITNFFKDDEEETPLS